MHLINVETFKLEEFSDDGVPPYTILSHTWGADEEEVSFGDMESGNIQKGGTLPVKLGGCCKQSKKDGFGYTWIDTCCINKANAVELSEAINSMFQWYRKASICYTYLSDVPAGDNPRDRGSKFFSSRWFQRGWTLQELLASEKLYFYNMTWSFLGTKSKMSVVIEEITGIPRLFLLSSAPLHRASIAQRMSWAAKRVTKRKEDIAYCLLGIFGVNMPMIYGEGDQAFRRLQEEIMKDTRDDSILAWGLNSAESIPRDSTKGSGSYLATAPADFAECRNIVSREQYNSPMNLFEISGGCLRIHLPLHTTSTGEMYGLLNCGPQHKAEQVVGIPLNNALSDGSSDEYIRPQGRYSVLLPKSISNVSSKLIRIWKQSQIIANATTSRRYWFYIEESIDADLELIEVHPNGRWQQDSAMISTATDSDGNTTGRSLARLRTTCEESLDIVVILESEVQARCYLMTSSRDTTLEDLSRKLICMKPEEFARQIACNGTLDVCVTVRQEWIARRPTFVVRLATIPSAPGVTVDTTLEPLLWAAKNGYAAVVKLLLENGADIESEYSKSGWTPLNSASDSGHVEVVQLLLENGADITTESNDGWTPLNSASCNGHAEVVQLLLENGADITTASNDGWTPLNSASYNGHVEVIQLLLKNGADITTANNGGWTPLHSASYNDHVEVIKLLSKPNMVRKISSVTGLFQSRASSTTVPVRVSSDLDLNKTNKVLRPGGLNAGHGPGKSPETKLVIAIDFGTTYTSIAYAFTSNQSNIRVIRKWKGSGVEGRNDISQVPSLIKYEDSEPVTFKWGYETNMTDNGVIKGIKLSLEPGKLDFHQLGPDVEEYDIVHNHETVISYERLRLQKSTVDIVADYLGAVYDYAISEIRNREFPGTVETTRKEFVVTVPAIWSDNAKTATLMAARKAHSDLQLNPDDVITETEAAALFTIKAYGRRNLKRNDAFVLCDAGGRTVVNISYQVTSLWPKLRMKEIVSPSGVYAGSMMLNNSFERYLRQILGEEQFEAMLEGDAYTFNSIMNEFDKNIKPNFSSREAWDSVQMLHSLHFSVDIEDDPEHGIVGNTLTLSGEVIQEIFDPIVDNIIGLVRVHIEKVQQETGAPAKAIFLVGGFGANKYLKNRLQDCMGSIGVYQPEDAWAAIVRGAVLSKMPWFVDVEARRACKSYGVMAHVPYIHNEYPKAATKHLVYDHFEEINRIPKMAWYIYKDDDLCRDHRVRYPFHRCVPEDFTPEELIFVDVLYESVADFPSKIAWADDVRPFCKLKCNLSSLTRDQLTKGEMGDGTNYYILEYDLVIEFRPALITFSVERNGISYGYVEAKY